jgi:hypothetical protein
VNEGKAIAPAAKQHHFLILREHKNIQHFSPFLVRHRDSPKPKTCLAATLGLS